MVYDRYCTIAIAIFAIIKYATAEKWPDSVLTLQSGHVSSWGYILAYGEVEFRVRLWSVERDVFFYTFNKYLFSAYFVPCIDLSIMNKTVEK